MNDFIIIEEIEEFECVKFYSVRLDDDSDENDYNEFEKFNLKFADNEDEEIKFEFDIIINIIEEIGESYAKLMFYKYKSNRNTSILLINWKIKNQKSKIKKSIIVIPARYASTRFPGKPLIDIQGKTMIRRVYEQACKSRLAAKAVVATDDERIFNHIQSFGGEVIMTSNLHKTGTERCAEVAANLDTDIIINVQGDEPFIAPEQIDFLIDFLNKKPQFTIGTLAKRLESYEKLCNPNTIKVIFNQLQEAIYFSRHPIPFLRDEAPENWLTKHTYYKHIGMYGYRRDTLLQIASLPPTPLEQAENLEQLRWMENGTRIGITTTHLDTVSIDTPEDLEGLLSESHDH